MSIVKSVHSSISTRLAFFAGGAAVSATLLMLAGAGSDGGGDAVPFTIDQEPVLFVDVAGFGLGGPLHSRLAVYTDGTVMVSDAANPFNDGSACFLYIGPDAAHELLKDLREAGAFSLTDAAPIGADIPLTTATIFQSGGNGISRAHTFSYTVAFSRELAEFQNIVQAFRDTYVQPGACSNEG